MRGERPVLMVSTCGASMLLNEAKDRGKETAGLLWRSANFSEADLGPEERATIDELVQACESKLAAASLPTIRKMSAELNGLIGYYDSQLEGRGHDYHVLLHTDTYQGRAVAGVVETYLRGSGMRCEALTFTGLRTNKLESFRYALGGLITWCEETLPGYRHSRFHVAFNLTGGFKSIQGWMQTLGMFYSDEIVYIFESDDQLLRIPRIPVAIDEGAQNTVKAHLGLFRRISRPGTACKVEEVRGIPEAFFYVLEGEAELSPWGRLVWERCRRDLYSGSLLDPPSAQIKFTEKFKKAAASLAPERLLRVNERLDGLASCLAGGPNPRRLDKKKLAGNPRPPSTWECDAWADQAAWRIFAHDDGADAVLDDLGPGLH